MYLSFKNLVGRLVISDIWDTKVGYGNKIKISRGGVNETEKCKKEQQAVGFKNFLP